MLLAAYLCTAFVISSISAYYLVNGRHSEFAKKCFSFALLVIVITIPLQIWMGDEAGLKDHEYQPIKTAAIEGNWQTQNGAPLLLFAIPDQQQQKNLLPIGIPHLASVINTHQWNGRLQGLTSVPKAQQPFVPLVFYSFRIMVAAGLLMLLIGLVGLYLRSRRKLYDTPWFLRANLYLAPLGFIALITGWFTAETGRQPWVVYGMLKTTDAVSRVHTRDVIISLILLLLVYGVIFGIFYFRYLFRVIKKGPGELEQERMPFAYMAEKEKV
jgi:cytochrome d ubiquinol oxidase subunit I